MRATHDVFICHASEDKERFVQPFAETLRRLGVKVWYDDFALSVGDSVSQEIDRGIAGARYGIVVVSQALLCKPWPEHELRGLVTRDVEEDFRILPIWIGVTKAEVRRFSPSLSDKLAIDMGKSDVLEGALTVLRTIRPDLYEAHPRGQLERLASGEALNDLQSQVETLRAQLSHYQCPYCQSELVELTYIEYDEKNSGEVETYECGYSTGGWQTRPCPTDSRFPKLTDYDLEVTLEEGRPEIVLCYARPRTEIARAVHLSVGFGSTVEEAEDSVIAQYKRLSRL